MFMGQAKDRPNSWGGWGARILHCHCEVVPWEAVHEAIFFHVQIPIKVSGGPLRPHASFHIPHGVMELLQVVFDLPHSQPLK